MKVLFLLCFVGVSLQQFQLTEAHAISLEKNPGHSKGNIKKALIKCGSNYVCSDCSDSSYIGTINSLSLSPDPPTMPNITVDAEITLSDTIASGNLTLEVTTTIFGIPIKDTATYNVCDISDPTCPASGKIEVKFVKGFPPGSPRNKYTGNAEAKGLNQSGDEKLIICVDIEFTLT